MKEREHTCACGFVWVAPVTLSAYTMNLSGEATVYCPRCGQRPCVSSPWLPSYVELVEAQMRFWQDSRILSPIEAVGWMNEDSPYRESIARSLACCLQHRNVVFYECGKRADGTYAWRGARYGIEGSQYISGFGKY